MAMEKIYVSKPMKKTADLKKKNKTLYKINGMANLKTGML